MALPAYLTPVCYNNRIISSIPGFAGAPSLINPPVNVIDRDKKCSNSSLETCLVEMRAKSFRKKNNKKIIQI